MDITGIDIVAAGSFLGSVGALVRAFLTDRTAREARDQGAAIEADRAKAKQERDEAGRQMDARIAVLEAAQKRTDSRLEESANNFTNLSRKIDTTNGLLRELIGFARAGGFSRCPEKTPNLSPMDGRLDL